MSGNGQVVDPLFFLIAHLNLVQNFSLWTCSGKNEDNVRELISNMDFIKKLHTLCLGKDSDPIANFASHPRACMLSRSPGSPA